MSRKHICIKTNTIGPCMDFFWLWCYTALYCFWILSFLKFVLYLNRIGVGIYRNNFNTLCYHWSMLDIILGREVDYFRSKIVYSQFTNQQNFDSWYYLYHIIPKKDFNFWLRFEIWGLYFFAIKSCFSIWYTYFVFKIKCCSNCSECKNKEASAFRFRKENSSLQKLLHTKICDIFSNKFSRGEQVKSHWLYRFLEGQKTSRF